MMAYISIDIDLYEIDTDDLIEELEDRGYHVNEVQAHSGRSYDVKELITAIYEAKRLGKAYDNMVDDLIYDTIGRII